MNLAVATRAEPAPDLPVAAFSKGRIPLSWVKASKEVPYGNLGDALSALVVGAIAGAAVRHANFNDPFERLVAIGTIAQEQRRGPVHLWGTGIDAKVNREQPELGAYTVPSNTTIIAHAVRGPHTAAALRRAGVACPPIYGDPAWFLPKILPLAEARAKPTHELGVICHISELGAFTNVATPRDKFLRYGIPASHADKVRIINTYIEPTLGALTAKMAEILSCRRILSSSFHGLVLPLAYGLPGLYFGFPGEGFAVLDANDPTAIDHRFGDFFAGVGMPRVPAICTKRDKPTLDWDALMRIIDRESFRLDWSGRDLFEAFPGPRAVTFDQAVWPIDDAFKQFEF